MKETRREKFRKGLSELYLPHYDKLCELLPANWQPMSGYRSFQEQTKLFAKGRTETGPVVTDAQAGMSFHNYGLATDWWLFTDAKGSQMRNLTKDSPEWLVYIGACARAGLKCLNFERPHNQLILPPELCIDRIYTEYQNKGQIGVEALIKRLTKEKKK